MTLLSTLNGGQQQPQQPQQQIPHAPQTDIERIFAQFSAGQPQAAPTTQAQMQQPAPIAPGFDLQNALAALSQVNQGQQQPLQQQQQQQTPQPVNQLSQLQTILAQMGQQPAAQMQGYNYPNQYQGDLDRKRSHPGWGGTDGQNDYANYENNSKRQKGTKDKKWASTAV